MAMDFGQRQKLHEAQLQARKEQQEKAENARREQQERAFDARREQQREQQDRAHLNTMERNQRQREAVAESRRLNLAAQGENAIEAMRLNHELNIENRQMDFQIERKQAYLDLEKQTLLSVISQRQTAQEAAIAEGTAWNDASIGIVERIVDLVISRSTSEKEHQRGLENMGKEAELEVWKFEHKERFMQKIRAESEEIDEATISRVLDELEDGEY